MALLPVDKVVVYDVDNMLNTSTGFNNDIIILSVVLDRKTLDQLIFELIDPSDALGNFNYNMKYHKTAGLREVEKVTIY
ncbi:hypothetical protein [Clostridium gasigenes]|uniref:Uncharacterized protein n=1 Tax=Clostridium gasigenes TaxID=94869 RepID=A0A1H0P0I8_9CLOT|nr:hypothetical protein [Clostridium gasigenes]MBB6625069.1 hypothetical protein [Clostridium gasigenes]MBU3090243.1 hypothetical protein [Clostridium gasigenes]SDO98215.1 hypothetical protein SAMN04488529_1011021 [Clostridium gasigenes]